MKKFLLAAVLATIAVPAFAFGGDREATITSLLETAEQHAPNAGVTREMLEKLSPMQLHMFAIADCQGSSKTATFTVTSGRIVGFSATCTD